MNLLSLLLVKVEAKISSPTLSYYGTEDTVNYNKVITYEGHQ
ncbi:SH3 domain-containing protein [Streptococcus sp. ZJ93]